MDRACCQFEPDDKNYHRVVFSTYKHVDESKNYHVLESTRHLGPLLFYLAFNKKPDNFVLYCLETERYLLFNIDFILIIILNIQYDNILGLMMSYGLYNYIQS